jgi:ribose transport system permease protein
MFAVGSNPEAANVSGVNVKRTIMGVFALAGLLYAVTGFIEAARIGSNSASTGLNYELDAIASVALGGTSMNGGRGRIWGTFVGVLIIAVLNNGLNILGVSSYYQSVVKAIVILIAVLSDRKR